MEMLQYLEQFNLLSVFVRLALATVLGGLIGLERGSHGQPQVCAPLRWSVWEPPLP